MKRILSLVLAAVMVASIFAGLQISSSALALNGQCGENVYWSFNSSTGTLTISGQGKMTDYNPANSPFVFASEIKKLIINNGVTSVGEWAFRGCSDLSIAIISDSVRSVGYCAFFDCSGLKELSLPASANISNDFDSNTGYCTFYNCENVEKVILTKGNGTMQDYGISISYYSNSTYYKFTPWNGSKKLKEIIIENGIENIGSYAFRDCRKLKYISIPDSVQTIGNGAFYGCSGLKEIKMPCSAIIINKDDYDYDSRYEYTFKNCKNIEKITLTKGTGTMPNYQFPPNYDVMGSAELYYRSTPWYASRTRINEVIIEDGVLNIGTLAFYECKNLRSIVIPNSIISIDTYAFVNCLRLKHICYIGNELQWSRILGTGIGDSYIGVGDSYIKVHYNYDPNHAHSYNDKVLISPTSNTLGYRQYECSKCGKIKKDEAGNIIKDKFTAPTGKPAGFKCASRTAKAMKFTWTKTKGVSGYQVQISNAKGTAWSTFKTLTANSYTFSKLTAGSAYKARVRFYIKAADGKNYYGAWTTITSPTLPAGTSLTKVTPAKKAFTAKWKKGACTGYQLQFGRKANFKGAKTVTFKNVKTVKYTAKKLTAKKYYYVRIRTYKKIAGKNYFSAWSKTYKVKTK